MDLVFKSAVNIVDDDDRYHSMANELNEGGQLDPGPVV